MAVGAAVVGNDGYSKKLKVWVFEACFKRRGTAVLGWLDCSSSAARH